MAEVFFSVLRLVQLLARVIGRQDFPAGIIGKEDVLVVATAAVTMTNVSHPSPGSFLQAQMCHCWGQNDSYDTWK